MEVNIKKITRLENTVRNAKRETAKYFAIMVKIEGAKDPEIIINLASNFESKLEYYKRAYNEDLCLKANPNICILDFTYANSLDCIEHELLGRV